MLTVYRANRAELLARILATKLRLDPPDPFTPVEVVVNTWPTSRWLGEQLALELGGVAAHLRFPFPGSHLRRLVAAFLDADSARDGSPDPGSAATDLHLRRPGAGGGAAGSGRRQSREGGSQGPGSRAGRAAPAAAGQREERRAALQADGGASDAADSDPWRADRLVWPLLAALPEVAEQPGGEPLLRWLGDRHGRGDLSLEIWRLGRAIADAFDDYALYRPDLLLAWEAPERSTDAALPPSQAWQPLLYRSLRQRLAAEPFGLRVERLIHRLRSGGPGLLPDPPPQPLRLFGLSSLAPAQVRLLQALSGSLPVELYLLTPCPDLWQRCTARRAGLRQGDPLQDPLAEEWLLQAPGLEARFGRLGAEFQQLLEGTGEVQLGESLEQDLFFLPATAASQGPDAPAAAGPASADGASGAPGAAAVPLLLQLQEQLADPGGCAPLRRAASDSSLEFHACPGRLRQVQIVRDRVLQLLAADPQLEPRDILVMTPQVDAFAPLVGAVFGDVAATGVPLPWRLTDRSQQAEAGLGRCLLTLLEQAGVRLTASGLESVLECGAVQRRFGLNGEETAQLHALLQRTGFRWGLDGRGRQGDATHSLSWAIDRLLLGLVLPAEPGRAAGDPPAAPEPSGSSLERSGRWLHLLGRLRHWLAELGRPASVPDWAARLRDLLSDLGGEALQEDGEGTALLEAIDAWEQDGGASPLLLEAAVVAAVLQERLRAESGRFGHRSGALTISALEPMRAIPHRVIVLMGLDAGSFPRTDTRPGFHLMGSARRLGDPSPADQDRYVLLEALLSARSHLLITWSCRDDRTGDTLMPSSPVRQWLQWLSRSLGDAAARGLLVEHPASPLERANFRPSAERPPASCDRRWLEARRQLDGTALTPLQPLIRRPMPEGPAAGDGPADGRVPPAQEAFSDLRDWLVQPQRQWLRQLGLRPQEWEPGLEDLEPLELDERDRSGLLRDVIGSAAEPDGSTDWLERLQGRGVLPARSGGVLEARRLAGRLRSLAEVAAGLGQARSETVVWGPWQAELRWRGDLLIHEHVGKESPPQLLTLWLQHLLASAACGAGSAAAGARLIVRRDDCSFGLGGGFAPLDPDSARAELERLAELREAWRQRCWPVPPCTGWAWWKEGGTAGGKALEEARRSWEGQPERFPERERPEMAVCFGADLSTEALIDDRFQELAGSLFDPPLQALLKPAAGGARASGGAGR